MLRGRQISDSVITMEIEKLRKDFEEVLPIPPDSGIEWYPERGQYLTQIDMWKKTAKGRTDTFQGWCLAAEKYASTEL